MAEFNMAGNHSAGYGGGQYGQMRMPGARREKVKGYLRAANELRQNYQSQFEKRLAGEDEAVPGQFEDMVMARSGEEEMLLFPSYARKHVKRKRSLEETRRGRGGDVPGSRDDVEGGLVSSGDADYWKREWERYEDTNAIVDVDVRGWIYSPQKGPLNRKHRLLVAVARRLSGIPAPNQQDDGGYHSRDNSPRPVLTSRRSGMSGPAGVMSKHEEMAAAKEAENIARRGQKEADVAAEGSYSLEPGGFGNRSAQNSRGPSRSNSPKAVALQSTGNSTDSGLEEDEDPGLRALSKRSSWHEPSNMSRDELMKSNEALMVRLRPFMNIPLQQTTITVFFFNDDRSTSKTVTTNDSGHFNLRAALGFVPTKVRVLASENLSATEEVIITESQGISLISDIDDTIKHSAIANGAREIFKNTFIRELHDLTIKGVKEWYSKLASMGVQIHYVSNSPWQLFPVLKSYFSMAGLPNGSFHLKQYSGMLQGIFEPAAERKKGSIDRIMSDFPDRKFVLVGDSGEADLEVYTDAVLQNPGRVLAVFIRDVTTPNKHGFFDQSIFHHHYNSDSANAGWSNNWKDHDHESKRPVLPGRPHSTFGQVEAPQEDLIDFSEESDTQSLQEVKKTSYSDDLQQLGDKPQRGPHGAPPSKPAKPSSLRTSSVSSPPPTNHDRPAGGQDASEVKKRPTPPPKPRRLSQNFDAPPGQPPWAPFSSDAQNKNNHRLPTGTDSPFNPRPHPPARANTSATMRSNHSTNQEEGYIAAARRQMNSAYNALPAIRSQSPVRSTSPGGSPARRGLAAAPAAAARWATGATGGDPAAGGEGGAPGQAYNKKEEMWRRRWARAEDIMRSKGVVLRTWRVGGDVMNECVKIVERAQLEIERPRRGGFSSI